MASGVGFDLPVTLTRISAAENGKCLIVLKSTRYLSYMTLLREQNAELIISAYDGLRVPKNALRVDENGVSGVYCLVGRVAYFKPVSIVYQGSDYCLVEPGTIEAAKEAGRDVSEITLVGASKMNDADACRQAIAAGIDVLGENREQEMTKKLAEHAYDGAPLHFIGHLQRNKVKNVVGKVAMIESVGSLELLSAIDKQAEKLGIVQDILLEVNIGGEEAKSGFAPESLEQAAEEAKKCANVRVRGLMCIPPVAEGEHGSLPYFEKVHALFVDINAKLYDNTLDILSMGMSGDYEDAVRAGATMVRVGTAIFGARNYTI